MEHWLQGSRDTPVSRPSRHREERKDEGVCENSTRKSETEYMKCVMRHIPLPSVFGRDLNSHFWCNMQVVGDSRLHKFNQIHLRFLLDFVRRSRADVFGKALACGDLSAGA